MTIRLFNAVLAATTLTISGANASIYQYSANQNLGNNGGAIDLNISFNDTTDRLDFSLDLEEAKGFDGGWIVISPGDNPKYSRDELAILYFDGQNIAAYEYHTTAGTRQNSWQNPAVFIDSFIGVVDNFANAGTETFQFSIDASTINNFSTNPDWTGVSFGRQAGVWFHPYDGTISFDSNGALSQFSYTYQAWHDTRFRSTALTNSDLLQTPLPAAAPLFLAGILGFGAAVGKRKVPASN